MTETSRPPVVPPPIQVPEEVPATGGEDVAQPGDVAGPTDGPGPVGVTGPVAPIEDGGDPEAATSSAEPDPIPPTSMGEYRMAIVTSVTVDLPVQHPTVVLRETESPRRQLSFSVGLQDGIAISHALRRITTPRPLTHELVADILLSFDIDVVAVRLVGRQGSTYFAELDLRGRNGRSVQSCRPSDALTIALRQPVPVPILIDSRLLEVLGDVAPA
ncbi:MAG TPA: bifunctional nuclease family protein [Acidimicrobiales bacterium]|nr:bifunctional nuclease family protein [Acidimicrobiales bacterium]